MKDETQLLIDLIKQNKTLNEISEITKLSNKQIFMKLTMLRNSGYLIDKNYYYNGEIRYSLHNPFKTPDNTIYVATPKNNEKIRVLSISDTHLGHKYDNVECIHSMTEYCIRNGIHLVLHSGDFFDGIYPSHSTQKFSTAEEQIAYALKNYPYDKSILNFVLLGNHDATFWTEIGIDIKTILENRRHDIVPLGYGCGEVNIGGCQFKLHHRLSADHQEPYNQNNTNKIILKGHSHKYKINPGFKTLTLTVPTLSNVRAWEDPIPSMIDIELEIKNGKISTEYFQQFIYIDNKPIRVNEIEYCIPLEIENPKYEEDIVFNQIHPINNESLSTGIQEAIIEAAQEVKLHKTDQYQGMNQIDKFNARYQKTLK